MDRSQHVIIELLRLPGETYCLSPSLGHRFTPNSDRLNYSVQEKLYCFLRNSITFTVSHLSCVVRFLVVNFYLRYVPGGIVIRRVYWLIRSLTSDHWLEVR